MSPVFSLLDDFLNLIEVANILLVLTALMGIPERPIMVEVKDKGAFQRLDPGEFLYVGGANMIDHEDLLELDIIYLGQPSAL